MPFYDFRKWELAVLYLKLYLGVTPDLKHKMSKLNPVSFPFLKQLHIPSPSLCVTSIVHSARNVEPIPNSSSLAILKNLQSPSSVFFPILMVATPSIAVWTNVINSFSVTSPLLPSVLHNDLSDNWQIHFQSEGEKGLKDHSKVSEQSS